jgi:hypothetical protein
MTPENFTYWLQGFFEMSDSTELTEEQVVMVKEHLKLVFDKKTTNPYVYPTGIQDVQPDWTLLPQITCCTQDHVIKDMSGIIKEIFKPTVSC